MWTTPETKGTATTTGVKDERRNLDSDGCKSEHVGIFEN